MTSTASSSRTGERGIALIMVVLVTTFLSALGLGADARGVHGSTGHRQHGGLGGDAVCRGFGDRSRRARPGADRRLGWGAHRRSAQHLYRRRRRRRPRPSRRWRRRSHGRDQHVELRQVHELHYSADERELHGSGRGASTTLAGGCLPTGRCSQFTELARPAACYLAVWVADDGREQDGDPLADAAGRATAGARNCKGACRSVRRWRAPGERLKLSCQGFAPAARSRLPAGHSCAIVAGTASGHSLTCRVASRTIDR